VNPIVLTIIVVAALAVPGIQSSTPADCRDAADCRQQALDAASRQQYEQFHDLAWRAVQKGRANDAELMTLLARAQSLSGRPHDAFVMLNRLAAMGVSTDAATSDDFRRVRALPGWADLEARIAGAGDTRAQPSEPAAPTTASTAAPDAKAAAAPRATPGSGTEKSAASESARDAPVVGEPVEALRFTTTPFTPAGLAYDSVSNRFIVGDGGSRRLSVVGEASHNVSNYASAETAGLGEVASLAIDSREGDLWIVSSTDGSATLHKLQLISGRALFSVEAADGTSAHFVDLGVTPQSTVIALDDAGKRLFRLSPGSKKLHVAATLDVADLVSVATSSDAVAFVAHRDGIVRVDLSSRAARPVRASKGIDLKGLAWIRRYRDGLVAIQRAAGGLHRIVRIRLDASGTRATALALLDRDVSMAAPTAAAVSGDVLYYLSTPPPQGEGTSGETIVRRLRLR
jgi:hypothetical protein